jgi:hypothetical protein
MPSNYPTFDVAYETAPGLPPVPVPNAVVKVWNVTANADLGVTLNANSAGVVAGGSLNVAVGTTVRFRCENQQGRSGFFDWVTT